MSRSTTIDEDVSRERGKRVRNWDELSNALGVSRTAFIERAWKELREQLITKIERGEALGPLTEELLQEAMRHPGVVFEDWGYRITVTKPTSHYAFWLKRLRERRIV